MRQARKPRRRVLTGSGLCCALASFALLTTPAVALDAVTITVKGEITPNCAIAVQPGQNPSSSNSTAIDLGSGDAAGSKAFTFSFSCNAAFTYRLESLNGGLALQGPAPESIGSFEGLAPYDLELALPLDGGSALQVRCDSRSMSSAVAAACTRGASNGLTAINQTASATVRWTGASHDRPRLAGTYSDTLVIRMSPAL